MLKLQHWIKNKNDHPIPLLKPDTASLDGKYKTLSWNYAIQLEARFKQEIDTLMKLAEAIDNTPLPENMDAPKELKRRQTF